MSYLQLCYGAGGAGECAGCATASMGGRARSRLSADTASAAEDTGRLTPLIRTARLLERPEGAGSLPVEAATALAGSGGDVGLGNGQQQAGAASDAAMQDASAACTEQQLGRCEPQRGEQPGRHRLVGAPECGSGSSLGVPVGVTSLSRASEEQRSSLLSLGLECRQSPNGRSQPAPSDIPRGSCRPSSCRRLRFC